MCSQRVQLCALILRRVQRAIALLHIDIMQYTAIYPHLCSTPWYIDTSSATLSTTGLMARTSVSSAA